MEKIKFVLEMRTKHREVSTVRSYGLLETINHATKDLFEHSRAIRNGVAGGRDIQFTYTLTMLRAGINDITVYGSFTDQLNLKKQITEEIVQMVMIEELQRAMIGKYPRYQFDYDIYQLTNHTKKSNESFFWYTNVLCGPTVIFNVE